MTPQIAAEVERMFALASAEQIVLQAASRKVRRIHKSVDLEEANRRKLRRLHVLKQQGLVVGVNHPCLRGNALV